MSLKRYRLCPIDEDMVLDDAGDYVLFDDVMAASRDCYNKARRFEVIRAELWAMVEHHEASKYPPVRGMTPTPDPMTPSAANPFADLEDDLPWEETKGKKP